MSPDSTPQAERRKSVARNPKATHDYHILETWESGIVLTGTEVKSLRNGKASIKEAYARVRNGEIFLEGMNITPYEQGNRYNHDPVRTRKLLLHRREIEKLIGAVEQKGLTLIPLELYFKDGRAKVALALGRGKKLHDKREDPQAPGVRARDGARRVAGKIRRREGRLMLTALALALAAVAAPSQITIAGRDGRGHASSSAPTLRALRCVSAPQLTRRARGHRYGCRTTGPRSSWPASRSASCVGAPLYSVQQPAPSARRRRVGSSSDTLYLPFQFVAEVIPYYLGERYRYDARTARLEDITAGRRRRRRPSRRTASPTASAPVTSSPSIPVMAGVDPGNPGIYFPRGVREKDVTLQVGVAAPRGAAEAGRRASG